MKEVDWRLKSIMDRRNLDMRFQASIHGVEVKTPRFETENAEPIKIDDKQEEALKRAQQEAESRMRKRYGR